MINETSIKENEVMVSKAVAYTVPQITFPGFDDLMKKAENVAEYIDSVNLTDENIPEVKKVLANARKLVFALDDERKNIKKEINAPVKEFETQIKEITAVIDRADARLRTELNAMDEKARAEKEELIRGLWEKRVSPYTFPKFVPDAFGRFLSPKHLNKTVSLNAVEDEMTSFMEKTEKDVNAILTLSDSEAVMGHYAKCLDMAEAVAAAKKEADYRKAAFSEKKPEEETAVFTVRGRAFISLTEKLLKENGIEFTRA